MPAPGATSFTTADGLGWIQLIEGGFECISAPLGLQASLHAQVTPATDPARHQQLIAAMPVPAQETYIVKPGDTPRSIAEAHGVTKQALLDANKDKIKWYDKDGRKVPGFEAGEKIVIPRTAPVAPAPPGGESWWDWGERQIDQIGDDLRDIGRGIGDWVRKEWNDWFGGGDDKDKDPAKGRRLPDATVKNWVDLATEVSSAREDKRKEPYEPAKMDEYLGKLAVDQKATDDPVQRRVLAGVQFQFETAKRGTSYERDPNLPRDYDPNGKFDCSEAVQWMLQTAGMQDLFGEATGNVATLYMVELIQSVFGDTFRKAPKTGDIMMWTGAIGHVGMVMDVRAKEDLFYVSQMTGSGSRFNTYPLSDPDSASTPSAKLLGFWSPDTARLPPAKGTATVKHTAHKFTMSDLGDGLGSDYQVGEELELLDQRGDACLVHHPVTRGAAWVKTWALTLDDADPR
jgi:hypothetical protein